MRPPHQDVERRRPVWGALSNLFLDSELDEKDRRNIAQTIVAAGYSPSEIQTILWEEVYPVAGANLRNPAGEWAGFDLDWMQQQILSGAHRRTVWMRIAERLPNAPARQVRQEWQKLLPFLPDYFRHPS